MLTILALLTMNIDGAIDIAQAGHPHEDPLAHQLDDSQQTSESAKRTQTDSDTPSNDHCEHCCHGHTSVVTASVLGTFSACGSGRQIAYVPTSVANFAQAPPTPPPNA